MRSGFVRTTNQSTPSSTATATPPPQTVSASSRHEPTAEPTKSHSAAAESTATARPMSPVWSHRGGGEDGGSLGDGGVGG